MHLKYINGELWAKIFVLLSMDIVIPFYHLMGLNLPNRQEFVQILRDIILESYKKQVDNPNDVSLFVTDSIRKIADKFGEDICLQLLQWGRFIFAENTHAHADLHQWKVILEYCHSNTKLWEDLGWSPMLSHEAQKKFLASKSMAEYDELHKKVYEQPLSDWDLCLYAIRRFDDEDPTATNRPDKWVYHTVFTEQNRIFFVWVLTKLNLEEQTILQKNAFNIVQNVEELKIKEELRHPRFLGKNYEY
ncbi:hypothetical protein PN36_21245 [Candidatus Thiomargarita nelsonii]|uniref:Uncharacterized protein n=1 Tax=Candidatus Thiomargarita nelsonii TaxID=1003181 RepID=A0A0A6P986_9GAMM|nr:hypothetical protein PN36_21245 [Candidatus Thiomargarita nelsonii]